MIQNAETAFPGADWRCGVNDCGCIEVASLGDGNYALRKSEAPGGVALTATRAELQQLAVGITNGSLL